MGLQAEIALLRAEMESLRAAVMSAGEKGRQGFGPDIGAPIVPVGGGDPQGTFRWEGDKITHCNFYAAHRVFPMPNVTVAAGQSDGTWYLNVPHGNPVAATVSKTQGPNDDDNTCIPLFMVQDGEIVADYRGMPFVPIYA